MQLLDQVEYRLAETEEEKDEIFRLRHRAYLREAAILPSPSERISDRYDSAPNTWVFGIYVQGELYSSIRVSVVSAEWRSSPSADMYNDILQPELDSGKIIVDPTRFVADPDKARRFPELPYVTVRLGWVACEHFDADIGLASVRAEHRAFYRRVFLQEPLAEPRLFPGLIKPVGLMAAKYPEVREKVFRRFPIMKSTHFERQMLFQRHRDKSPLVVDLPEFLPSQAAIPSTV